MNSSLDPFSGLRQDQERYVIYSQSWGVFLGVKSFEGGPFLGYWSAVNPIWRTYAPTFEDMEEAMKEISSWDFLKFVPSDIRYVAVLAHNMAEKMVAHKDECIRAGATNWFRTVEVI